MANKSMVLVKLESLQRALHRLQTKVPETAEHLRSDIDLQDILSVNLERAVQLCVDIGAHILSADFSTRPGTMSDVFYALKERNLIPQELYQELVGAVGYRNIAVHEYEKIDWNIVFSICTKNIATFKGFMQCLLTYLGES